MRRERESKGGERECKRVLDVTKTKEIDKQVYDRVLNQIKMANERLDEIDPESSFLMMNRRFSDKFNISSKKRNASSSSSSDRCLEKTDKEAILSALEILERPFDPETNQRFVACDGNVFLIRSLFLAFEVLMKHSDFGGALDMLQRRLKVFQKSLPPFWPTVGISHYLVGKLALYHYGSEGPEETDPRRIREAFDHLQSAFRILVVSHAESHPLMVKLQECISQANLQLSSLSLMRPRRSPSSSSSSSSSSNTL